MSSTAMPDLSSTQDLNVSQTLAVLKVSKGRLVCVNPRVLGEESDDVIVELHGPSLRIGRAKTNDVVLDASGVSRNHAEVSFKDQGWHVRDVGSSNGTQVNKTDVTQARLKVGDVISIGAVYYKFSLDKAAVVEDAEQQVSLFDVEKTLVLNQQHLHAETMRSHRSTVMPPKPRTANDKFAGWTFGAAIGAIVIITSSLALF